MSEFSVMTLEEIQTIAAGNNCEVIIAKENELQFDLDSDAAWENFQFFYHIKLANRFKEGISFEEWSSKSGHKHVVVTLPQSFSVAERIAMQSQGGSDIGREFAALACHWDGSPHPIVLFKPFPKLLSAEAA